MEEIKARSAALKKVINEAAERAKLPELEKNRADLLTQVSKPDFWQANANAQQIAQAEANLARQIQSWRELVDSANELVDLTELNDPSMAADLTKQADIIEQKFDSLKKNLRFDGPYDDHNVILNIYAGAGGTDAQDWAQMLLRMYLRWAEKQGIKAKVVDESPGEGAGIKSATLELAGQPYLYGKLAGEHGVHRLVRRSPFNSAASRETSFAKVDVLPLITRPSEVEIDDKDIKIDVFRAGGHGG
ncbi:MAG TPA: PCRF domain-containing protein, partial [Candidatus Saccharimonadales bacterium]|nr:PCRF domain-containing protein [Candidatus Saccharimonadales bacterium]